ncbi:hypothetical protein CR194_06400 [Salipaludibacillus keqinensis]|uniref:Uncharacterized protein n=1 Tax=Salipaludibacillus keqinensis TaxID=2045207 RepID=A0A323TJJ1_9BACI|nr:hypothetical protein [Salipaludibacillus keqinensis]PYZ95141.1 hypothetical protein CR194_06400 [Salipaludibacillus keqinensis]
MKHITTIPYPVIFGLAGAFSGAATILVVGKLLIGSLPWLIAIGVFIVLFCFIQLFNGYLKKKINQ